jgi:hypothetical protein
MKESEIASVTERFMNDMDFPRGREMILMNLLEDMEPWDWGLLITWGFLWLREISASIGSAYAWGQISVECPQLIAVLNELGRQVTKAKYRQLKEVSYDRETEALIRALVNTALQLKGENLGKIANILARIDEERREKWEYIRGTRES